MGCGNHIEILRAAERKCWEVLPFILNENESLKHILSIKS